jgi:hypothetical protein
MSGAAQGAPLALGVPPVRPKCAPSAPASRVSPECLLSVAPLA